MSEYISKETIQKICMEERSDFGYSVVDRIWRRIKTYPTADVRENIHGEWTEWKGRNGRYNGVPVCSNCNTGFPIFAKDYNFCPNCGADMRGKA